MLAGLAFAASGFHAPPASSVASSRLGAVTMGHTLNNYALEGPLVALGNQVLVKLNKADDKTDGGLYVPTAQTTKALEGTVVAAGPGLVDPQSCALIPNPFKEGDVVLLSDYRGEKVDYDEEKHIFMDADDVLGSFSEGAMLVDAFQPALDSLLVTRPEAATETSSGIALAIQDDDESNQGEVVATGPGRATSQGEVVAPSVAVGDSVLYDKDAGTVVNLEGKKYTLVSAGECFAKW